MGSLEMGSPPPAVLPSRGSGPDVCWACLRGSEWEGEVSELFAVRHYGLDKHP